MRFATSTIVALLAAPFLAYAQGTATSGDASTTVAAGQATSTANPFNIPSSGLAASAGSPLTLTWKPTTSGTVSLVLRSGSSNNLNAGTTIASNIQNSGSYTWQVPASVVRGSDYAVEIVDDSNPSETNYTPYFVIDSSNTVASASSMLSSTVTSGAPSSSLSLSSASNTLASTHTDSHSASGSSTASRTGSSSMMTSTTSGAPLQTTSAASSSARPSGNAAPRASAAAGVMGLIALGAFAL
ncbi:hypothetical protein MBLNU457_g0617t1 [Dothideomycetes sp. NU457]